MKLIKEQKINKGLVKFLLYLSFCFAGFYSARAAVAAMPYFDGLSPFIYGLFAFLVAGLGSFLLYLILVSIFGNRLRKTPHLPLNQMLYALPFFYIGANIVIGLFGILYYFVPIASIWGEIIVPIIATAAFFTWFLSYICKNYVKEYNWKAVVLYFGKMYITIVGIITVLNLVLEVI
ncbi:MAG: hypothetical protein E7350_04970 [Clostridiales bacterium]|nr:hypothetical protein [Clostridiales bacterium]